MRIRFLCLLSGLVLLAFSACKKDFHPGDTIEVVDTVSAVNATTLSFMHGWGGMLPIGVATSAWTMGDSLGGLRIPFALQAGDRLIATLQVGLSYHDTVGICADSMRVYMGSILGDDFLVTPSSQGVVQFDGAFSVDSVWRLPEGQWVKQFTRQQELIVGSDVPVPVVQTFAKLRSMNGGCEAGTVFCDITNRSLTLTVIHP